MLRGVFTAGNRIVAYEVVASQEVYDFTVPEYENYAAAGCFHHNTWAGSFETAMHLTGRYPDWWVGRTFDREVQFWAASVTGEVTRDGVQRLLIGRPGVTSEIGTAAIPADAIKELAPKGNIPNAYSMAVVKWGGGGDVQQRESVLAFKSYDQGREKFQASTLDGVWFDEEPPFDIYSEGKTRTNVGAGLVYLTFTPLQGMSETVRRYLIEKAPGTHVTFMGIFDAEHYSRVEAEAIVAGYPEHEREARAFGKPVLGSGAVYPVMESTITCKPFDIPKHWPRICGLDLGWEHPTVGVWIAHDRDGQTVYVYDVYKRAKQVPAVHASAIKARGDWIPVAWPHDALQTQKDSGKPMRDAYRKEGVRMLPERISFEDGSFGVEPGVQIILNRMLKGQFKVFDHLEDWLSEFRTYHRKDGEIVKDHDDAMDATRYAMMGLRFAKAQTAQVLSIYRTHWRA